MAGIVLNSTAFATGALRNISFLFCCIFGFRILFLFFHIIALWSGHFNEVSVNKTSTFYDETIGDVPSAKVDCAIQSSTTQLQVEKKAIPETDPLLQSLWAYGILCMQLQKSIYRIQGRTYMKLNEQIGFFRRQKGMTQEELAGRLGVTGQAVSKWESGVSHS